jgi:hypothetical protein
MDGSAEMLLNNDAGIAGALEKRIRHMPVLYQQHGRTDWG